MKEVQEIEAELLKFKKIEVSVDVIDKLLEVEPKDEEIIQKMIETTESKDEDIIIEKISGRLNNREDDEFIEKLSKKLYDILELEL